MADRAHQLPYVVAVTTLVTGLPAFVVWALRTSNIITSVWIGLALAVALSFMLSVAGSKIWEHGRYLANTLFSESFIWGWLRRVYVEHRISRSLSALDKLGADSTVYRSGLDRRRKLEERAHILTKIAGALDADDPYLNGHSRRVARYATGTARRMGLHSKDVATVQTAAELHDIGKLQLPPDITRKPGRLSTEEFAVVKRHADYGADMVRSVGDPALAEIVRDHHEHYDGTGYPSGLRGTGIPLAARITPLVWAGLAHLSRVAGAGLVAGTVTAAVSVAVFATAPFLGAHTVAGRASAAASTARTSPAHTPSSSLAHPHLSYPHSTPAHVACEHAHAHDRSHAYTHVACEHARPNAPVTHS